MSRHQIVRTGPGVTATIQNQDKPSAAIMLIRSATRDDIPTLVGLERASGSAAHWSAERYDAAVCDSHRTVLMLEDAGKCSGFLVAHAVDREWEPENLVISPSLRRRGFATKLLLEVLEQARSEGAHSMFLEVRESNFAARALYRKSGFLECGRRPNYYSQPTEDAILYRIEFP